MSRTALAPVPVPILVPERVPVPLPVVVPEQVPVPVSHQYCYQYLNTSR
jgi:hypothetical protein